VVSEAQQREPGTVNRPRSARAVIPAAGVVAAPAAIAKRIPVLQDHRSRSSLPAGRVSALACGILLAATVPAVAVDLDQMTVVTLARDGSWGAATSGSTGEAIAAAVRDCRAMAGAPTDCGAVLTATRGKWVLANLCGDHQVLVGAGTLEDAEATARKREIETRRAYVPDLPPCRRVLTVDPAGVAIASQKRPRPIDARHRGDR
jgi:hypothetical protein